MSPTTHKQHRFGEYVFLGVLVLLTLLIYNLFAWSQKSEDEPSIPTVTEGGMPTDFAGKVQLGNDFMDRGLWDHAIKQYEDALEIDDTQADIYVDLGACYHALGDFDKALDELNIALEKDPEHQIAWFNLGVVELSLADTTVAKGAWHKFLDIAGDIPQAEMVRQQLEKM